MQTDHRCGQGKCRQMEYCKTNQRIADLKGRVDKDHTDRQIIPDETHAARQRMVRLKVPKCENFHRADFFDFFTIKPLWVGDFRAKI
jgi:hypothetical protein